MLYDKRAKELPNFWSLKELAFYEMLFLPHETLYGRIHTNPCSDQSKSALQPEFFAVHIIAYIYKCKWSYFAMMVLVLKLHLPSRVYEELSRLNKWKKISIVNK